MRPRRQRRRPLRKLKEKIVSAITWAGFLAGVLKYVNDLPAFLKACDEFIDAPLEDKWNKLKVVLDMIWPVILDFTKIKASSYNVLALEAEFEAKGFDGSRLKKIFQALQPIILPILMEFLKPKMG